MYSGTYHIALLDVYLLLREAWGLIPCARTAWLGSRGMGVVFSSAGDCCKNISSRPWVMLMDRSGLGIGSTYVG